VTKPFHSVSLALALLVTSATLANSQEKPAEPSKTATIPLKLQIVISRFEGEKKISSMPYTLSANAGRPASLRVGARVPVASTSFTPIATGGAGVNPLTSFQYQDIGTNIDCSTTALEEGRFRVELTVDDSSVYPEDQGRATNTDKPSFRSFRATNSLVLKDGQTSQFTTGVDKVTGVVTKVDVTLTVVR
jgi:type II/III secretion system protein